MAQSFRIDVRSNTRQVLAEFRAFEDGLRDVAMVRAINRAIDVAQTEGGREIRKEYALKAAVISAAMVKRRARRGMAGGASGMLIVAGRPIGLIDFNANQTRRGVSVRIKKGSGRKVLQSAFIATTSKGYRGVFRRTGKSRYPIKTLRSVSIPQTFINKVVIKAVDAATVDAYERTLAQQTRFLMSKKHG